MSEVAGSSRAPARAAATRRDVLAAGLGAAGAVVAASATGCSGSAAPGSPVAANGSAAPGSGPGSSADPGGFRVAADGEPHERTWMAWPDGADIWGRQLADIQGAIALVARTIAKYEPVVLCANPGSVMAARKACGAAVTVIGSIPVDDCWIRDTGPVFRGDGAGRRDAIGLNFNGWGSKQRHASDALVARRIAAYAGVRFTRADLVAEGGAIESDGAGTLMATASSVINRNRNPGMSRRRIDQALTSAFGATRVIWFPGVRGRDITDDHVDATSRFVGRRAAVVQVPASSERDVWAADQLRQYRGLRADQAGITVTPIQGPDLNLIRQGGDPEFVSSYANYYVCDGAVICAGFGDPAADAAARATLARLFPGRVIEQLNVDPIGAGGGGIHCVTMPQPR